MPEYIERGELESILHSYYDRLHSMRPDFYAGFAAAIKVIDEETVNADVVPVRRGKWELHGNDDDLSSSYFCSLCGWNIDEDEYLDNWSHFIKFCPNCGSLNGGESDDNERSNF